MYTYKNSTFYAVLHQECIIGLDVALLASQGRPAVEGGVYDGFA